MTCRDVLTRLERDLGLIGGDFPAVPDIEKDHAACVGDALIASDNRLMLEEFEFSRSDSNAGKIADWIADHAVQDAGTADRLRSHLAVLHDDDFTHFVRNATEVMARVGLDADLKTVRKGALFYEEYLPPETLFYSLVLCSDSRRPAVQRSSTDILQWLRGHAPQTLQIGGGETVGKGFCAVRFDNGRDVQ